MSLALTFGGPSGVSAGWTPADLSDLILWLDSTDITTLWTDSGKSDQVDADGDVVGAWADKSGNGNDVTQATTANKPLYKTGIQNGEAALLFDGSNDSLAGAFSILSQPYHVIVVAKLGDGLENDTNYYFIFDGDDATNRSGIYKGDGLPDEWALFSTTSLSGGVCDDNWDIHTLLCNGASSNYRINGVSKATGNAGTANMDGITVGARYNSLMFWEGYISELLIVDPSMSDADRGLLEILPRKQMGYINMMTEWKWIMYVFFNRNAEMEDVMEDVAQAISRYSREDIDDERKMWNTPIKFSPNGKEPYNVLGMSFPVKKEMKDEVIALLDKYQKMRYVLLANTDIVGYEDRELIATNLKVTPHGQVVNWKNVAKFMGDEFRLIEIPPPQEEIIEVQPTIAERVRSFLGV